MVDAGASICALYFVRFMKIQYASDLHLELEENVSYLKSHPLEVVGDILVLAGDTIYLGSRMEDAGWFFDWCSENFHQTFLVPGNHEYYDGFPMEQTLDSFELKVRENVTYLNNRFVRIDDTELFFTTLWTSIPEVEGYTIEKIMNDCRRNRIDAHRFDYHSWKRVHRICREWLISALKSSTAEHKIVVSHHCPYMCEQIRHYVGTMAESAYSTPVFQYVENLGVDTWIHGHVHTPLHSVFGQTYIDSNPMGYVDDEEHVNFRPGAIIV